MKRATKNNGQSKSTFESKRKRVAIIGSQGVPARYGGFESLVENIIGKNASGTIEYTIYCSAPDMDTSITEYKGCRLRYLPLRAHGVMSVPYDILSMLKALRRHDTLLILGVSGCIFLPFIKIFTRKRIIVNIDGLEHNRQKWSKLARKFLKISLNTCVRWADVIISDNKGIQEYVKSEYNRHANLIAYGGDHVLRDINPHRQKSILDYYGLQSGEYDLSICRIEPENNCHITLQTYENRQEKIVFIGNWYHSDYSKELYKKYCDRDRYILLDSIYDLDILFVLRNNARRYIHGHRSGGTNPSLVEAMFFGKPILAYNVIYNRHTTQDSAYYYSNAMELEELLDRSDLDGDASRQVAYDQYIWKQIAHQYEELY